MSETVVVILLGIVEGITEFLPVSSTGHLLLVEHWLHVQRSELFNIVIQIGAVLAVIPIFKNRFAQCLRWRDPIGRDYALKILAAFFITGVGGLFAKKAGWTLPHSPLPIGVALLIGGVAFIAVELLLRGRWQRSYIGWDIVLAVGIGQVIAAIFPGTSRSGATILLALLLGLNRPAATEFSFLVSIPTMLAAGGWEILHELRHQTPGTPPENWNMVLLASAIAAVVSFVAVKWLLRYVQTHTFVVFGWYRVAVGGLILLLMAH